MNAINGQNRIQLVILPVQRPFEAHRVTEMSILVLRCHYSIPLDYASLHIHLSIS